MRNRPTAAFVLSRGDTELVVPPPPCPLAIAPIDFGHADVLVERGHGDAVEFLDSRGARRPRTRTCVHPHGARRRKDHAALVAN